jgi:hypothetical protein
VPRDGDEDVLVEARDAGCGGGKEEEEEGGVAIIINSICTSHTTDEFVCLLQMV